uniref:Uncharacterized protein n=1 Tax=Rhizophora mucronata TaxID=61149 RepID=A0A2P2P0Y6_RHIMU
MACHLLKEHELCFCYWLYEQISKSFIVCKYMFNGYLCYIWL